MSISGRSLEAATSLITGAFGAAVVVSSLDNGIGWSTAGVEAGAFPFIVGLVIVAGSLFNLVQGWRQARPLMLSSGELKRLGGLFVHAAVYVGAIPLIGMYLASGVYVFGAFAWHRRGSLLFAGAVAIAMALALYLIFELTFQISLPRGLLVDALGW